MNFELSKRPDLPADLPAFNLHNAVRVSVESPFFHLEEAMQNKYIAYARKAMADCIQRGEVPFASHLIYTQPGILDDNVRAERERGFYCRGAMVMACHRLAVYTDFGISKGMQHALDVAAQTNMPVDRRSFGTQELDVKFFTPFCRLILT